MTEPARRIISRWIGEAFDFWAAELHVFKTRILARCCHFWLELFLECLICCSTHETDDSKIETWISGEGTSCLASGLATFPPWIWRRGPSLPRAIRQFFTIKIEGFKTYNEDFMLLISIKGFYNLVSILDTVKGKSFHSPMAFIVGQKNK